MATTNLIVDFLVIGFVSLIWIIPLVILVVDIELTDLGILGYTSVIPAILAFFYIMGIVINRLSDDITEYWNKKWKEKYFGRDRKLYHRLTNYVIAVSDSATEYLSYRRSVIRTARACALNFMIAFPLWLIVGVYKPITIKRNIAYSLSLSSFLMALILIRSWYIVLKGYFRGIIDLYNALYGDSQLDIYNKIQGEKTEHEGPP